MLTPESLNSGAGPPFVFPPELVPRLHEKLPPEHPCLWGIADERLVNLLTTVFFASPQLDRALRGALLGEGDRALRELAALTAMDGAALLTRGRAIVGFGIVLPYASRHPESVVLMASQSGGIACMLRQPSWPSVVLFRFGPRGALRG